MKTMIKASGKEFTVLNLSDPQLKSKEWEEGHGHRRILEYTVNELVDRLKPDLITVSGDLSWAGQELAYDMLADFLDGFGIPWAPVFGNHDNQNGPEAIDEVVRKYLTYKNCIYEPGDRALGNGNYVISIEEDGVPAAALLMLDSHDRVPYTAADGSETRAWGKLIPEQLTWIEEQAACLKQRGCTDATLIMHIPNYAYHLASAEAYKEGIDMKAITPEESYGPDCWNPGYTDSIGVQYEGIGSYPEDDGVLDAVKRTGIIKRILTGHDHVNNWIIRYSGIDMIYALKTGAGCYWNPILNGGTVLKIDRSGVSRVYHEYVDVSHLLESEKKES